MYKEGQKIWVAFPWADEYCWVKGEFVKETAKRYKVNAIGSRGIMYVAKKNVKPREE